jgi:hypothetical protein
VDEKEAILKSLKSIAMNTEEECIALLNDFSVSTIFLCFLPSNDKNDMNIEISNFNNKKSNFKSNFFLSFYYVV